MISTKKRLFFNITIISAFIVGILFLNGSSGTEKKTLLMISIRILIYFLRSFNRLKTTMWSPRILRS